MLPQLSYLWLFLPIFMAASEQVGRYHKTYYPNGNLKAEGWVQNGDKTDYWKFYHLNGTLSEEGHFAQNERNGYWHFYNSSGTKEKEGHYNKGLKTKWWLFYDRYGNIAHKCQLKNDKKHGYCLKYRNQKLTSAEKYENGKKINEWFSFASFRRDNALTDLE
ncbi:toxin-antitoxin system YwqK family antitoxin [Pseudozobellia thermophila]|uniref:MORN repeat variant n=1 Tax=Pseudozobellia thermophila TaxID=192903 RepID=A0A1M6D264_9FLAO|nr:hypothetical protein [Pseudozobellia thermophila]SHI67088.1 hypothetical protein SAMN04488513_101950 [Pseudozobellia thermophila]